MDSLANVATQLNICKTMAIALPRFYRKTQISAQFSFIYNPDTKDIEISLGFSPKEPTKEQYSILMEELVDAEKLLINEYVMNTVSSFETVKQIVFKHKEETQQIISKHKKEDL